MKKVRQAQEQMQIFCAQMLDDVDMADTFAKDAKGKILDITKALGALITLGDYDFEFALESISTEKLRKETLQNFILHLLHFFALKIFNNFIKSSQAVDC